MEMRGGVMKRLLALSIFFLLTSSVWAAPSNTMSVTPACTSGTTILCSDETTRNNNISTPYNAHSHTDIAAMTGVNTFTIGDNAAGNKDYCEDGATDRCIRYNSSADLWTIQQGGTTYNQVVTFSGVLGIGSGQVLVSNGTASIVGLTAGASGTFLRSAGAGVNPTWSTPTFPNTGGTAGQWLRTDGTNYGLSTPTLPNSATTTGQYLCSDGTNWVACAAPAFGRVVLTSGNVTTTSTTPADLTGATVTLTTGAFPLQVNFGAVAAHGTADAAIYFRVLVDANADFGTYGLEIHTTPTINKYVNCSFSYQSAAQTAASHTVKTQWAVDAGTATLLASAQTPCILSTHEIR